MLAHAVRGTLMNRPRSPWRFGTTRRCSQRPGAANSGRPRARAGRAHRARPDLGRHPGRGRATVSGPAARRLAGTAPTRGRAPGIRRSMLGHLRSPREQDCSADAQVALVFGVAGVGGRSTMASAARYSRSAPVLSPAATARSPSLLWLAQPSCSILDNSIEETRTARRSDLAYKSPRRVQRVVSATQSTVGSSPSVANEKKGFKWVRRPHYGSLSSSECSAL